MGVTSNALWSHFPPTHTTLVVNIGTLRLPTHNSCHEPLAFLMWTVGTGSFLFLLFLLNHLRYRRKPLRSKRSEQIKRLLHKPVPHYPQVRLYLPHPPCLVTSSNSSVMTHGSQPKSTGFTGANPLLGSLLPTAYPRPMKPSPSLWLHP